MDQTYNLPIYAKPNGSQNKIEQWIAVKGTHWLQVRVTAKAQEGAANRAIISLLAQTLGIAKSHIFLVRGATARYKIFQIAIWSDALAQKLPQHPPPLTYLPILHL